MAGRQLRLVTDQRTERLFNLRLNAHDRQLARKAQHGKEICLAWSPEAVLQVGLALEDRINKLGALEVAVGLENAPYIQRQASRVPNSTQARERNSLRANGPRPSPGTGSRRWARSWERAIDPPAVTVALAPGFHPYGFSMMSGPCGTKFGAKVLLP